MNCPLIFPSSSIFRPCSACSRGSKYPSFDPDPFCPDSRPMGGGTAARIEVYREGVEGRPVRLKVFEWATVPALGTGAPRRMDGGLEAVCRFSRAGDGENGRAAEGMGGVSLIGIDWFDEIWKGMTGMIGIGRWKT